MKKVIVLSFCLCVCASVVANSACNDPLGWLVPEDVKCNCAHPIIDFKTMRVSCKPTYCPAGMECMENGHCCDGKVVDNYVDGIGVSGKVCCKETSSSSSSTEFGETSTASSTSTPVAAVNGGCCFEQSSESSFSASWINTETITTTTINCSHRS